MEDRNRFVRSVLAHLPARIEPVNANPTAEDNGEIDLVDNYSGLTDPPLGNFNI
jgi:hypothetical protein